MDTGCQKLGSAPPVALKGRNHGHVPYRPLQAIFLHLHFICWCLSAKEGPAGRKITTTNRSPVPSSPPKPQKSARKPPPHPTQHPPNPQKETLCPDLDGMESRHSKQLLRRTSMPKPHHLRARVHKRCSSASDAGSLRKSLAHTHTHKIQPGACNSNQVATHTHTCYSTRGYIYRHTIKPGLLSHSSTGFAKKPPAEPKGLTLIQHEPRKASVRPGPPFDFGDSKGLLHLADRFV